MSFKTGTFEGLGQNYETGSNAALLGAIAQGAEELSSGQGWPEGVNHLLSVLGRATGVSRVWIFQTIELTDTHIVQDYTFEWAASRKYKQIGMPMFSMSVNKIGRVEYRELIESRKRGEWQKVLPSTLEEGWLRDTLLVQRIKSMLTIPVMVEGKWWGTLGFDDCERAYDWSDVEIALLRTAGYLIANAVMRDRLSAQRQQFEIFRQLTDSNAWQFNLSNWHLWCTADILHSFPIASENLYFPLRKALQFIHSDDRKQLLETVKDALKKKDESVFRCDLRVYSDCGDIRWVEIIGAVKRDGTGEPRHLSGIAVDIRHRKLMEERLRREAATDPLTGVMNRRRFEHELTMRLESSRKGEGEFSVLLIDLDRFKELNDEYGHQFGDEALKHFAKVCFDQLRQDDILARLGGDEFVLLLSSANREEIARVIDRIRNALVQNPVKWKDVAAPLKLSVGCAIHRGDVSSYTKMLERADVALYSAKRQGRDILVFEEGASCGCS